jgi:Ser/Thr protein kinase RdoA (MazF antagonist)
MARPEPHPAGVLSPSEINAVLSRYELGHVASARELRGGAGASPKALVDCSRGRLVLKRWPRGQTDPLRVVAAHRVQLALHAEGFPTPRLLGARDGNTIVQHAGGLYELSAWIDGEPFARSVVQARSSGAALARLHALLREARLGLSADEPVPLRPAVEHALNRIESAEPALRALAERLRGVVAWADRRLAQLFDAAAPVEPVGVLHGDWHPGNLLFLGPDLAAAFDFDAVRAGRLGDELAQGALQHALQHTPDARGEPVDAELLTAFWGGYARGAGRSPLAAEAAAARMIESIALEGVRWGGVALARRDAARASRVLSLAVAAAEWLAAQDGQLAEKCAAAAAGGR